MGTEMHLSDGEIVKLTGESDGVVVALARALDRGHTDGDDPLVPRGFALFQDLGGEEVWVNAAQVASIRPT
jgi:hypothetical protein